MKLTMQTDDHEQVWVVLEDQGYRFEFSGVVNDAELSQELEEGLDILVAFPRLVNRSHVFNLKLVGIKTITRIAIPAKQETVTPEEMRS